MQAPSATPQAAAPPATPATPATTQGTGTSVVPIVAGAPTTARELRELNARRSEISRQLNNVEGRRNELATQLRAASTGADRVGLEGRIAALDKRMVDLENDLNVTGRQLAAARGQAAIAVEQPPQPGSGRLDSDQMTGIVIVFTLAVLMPLSIAWAKAILRQGKQAGERPSADLTRRLDRMEEGIDAIAIEVERISEGQRFVSKLLGEGAAQPVPVGAREPASAVRSSSANGP